MIETIRGWLVVSACGWAIFPFLHLILATLPDRGYAVSRALGVAFATWIGFWLVDWSGRPLGPIGAIGAIALLAALAWGARRMVARGAGPEARERLATFVRRNAATLIAIEGVVLGGLVIASWLLRRNPAVDPDSERFMDYAFLKATLRSPGLPVADPWFAGEPLHYYHFAYAMAAFLVRAAGAEPSRFFITALALTHVLVWAGAMGLGLALTGRVAGGLLAAFLVLGAGNFEWIRQVLSSPGLSRFDWFASSRVISGGITEVPWFSLLWGDLHPYVAALPLFLAGLIVPLADSLEWEHPGGARSGTRCMAAGRCVLFALCCGALLATHPWDLPFLLLAVLLLAGCASRPRPIRRTLAFLLMPVAGAVLFWPFIGGFVRHGRGMAAVPHRTSAAEWLMAYGPLVLAALSGFLIVAGRRLASRAGEAAPPSPRERAIWATALTGLAAAVICEMVYVEDLFSGTDLARMNTIFKLYRIAWVCLALSTAALVVHLVVAAGRRSRVAVLAVVVGGLIPAAVYPVLGTVSWLEARASARRRADQEGYGAAQTPGVDAEALFRLSSPGDAAAAAALGEQARPGEAVLEESGEPYDWSSRIATFSGVPTLLGWGNHEAVWRDGWAPIKDRQLAIAAIYADPGSDSSRALLRRYDIAWVVVGERERERYGGDVAAAFACLGRKVVEDHGTILFRLSE